MKGRRDSKGTFSTGIRHVRLAYVSVSKLHSGGSAVMLGSFCTRWISKGSGWKAMAAMVSWGNGWNVTPNGVWTVGNLLRFGFRSLRSRVSDVEWLTWLGATICRQNAEQLSLWSLWRCWVFLSRSQGATVVVSLTAGAVAFAPATGRGKGCWNRAKRTMDVLQWIPFGKLT